MSRSKRELRNLPGYQEARATLAHRRPGVSRLSIDHPGLWIPPRSITNVTIALLDGIFVGVERHGWESGHMEDLPINFGDHIQRTFYFDRLARSVGDWSDVETRPWASQRVKFLDLDGAS
ncbi:MAG TPA: hypothetical protein VF989_19025 [Polyangiaceae bacterium]